MIINRLVGHYEALKDEGKAPSFGWTTAAVNLGILLSEDGELINLITLNQTVQMGKKEVIKPLEMTVPSQAVKAAKVIANFLCDNASYMLGINEKEKAEKLAEKFTAAKEYHLRLLSGVDNPFAKAICAFFQHWDIINAKENPLIIREEKVIAEGRNLVFVMQGNKYAHDDPQIKEIWDLEYLSKQSQDKMICLVSGNAEPIARLHNKVKNLPGAQQAGANLVSINSNAFISYNICDNMPGAPIGEYSAFAYVTALNILIADFDHRIDLGDTRIVYWAGHANEKAADVFKLAWMPPPESDEHVLKEIFDRVVNGLPVDNVSLDEKFYVLGLRPNAARVSVSLFLQSTFGDMIRHIASHYKRMEIVRPNFDKRFCLTPRDIVAEIVNPNSTDKNPNPQMMMGLMRSILSGTKYPYSLYENALMRIRSEQGNKKISRGRAAIVKAILLQYLPENERKCITVSLNLESTNKPYLLGRLFAVLEVTQEAANPELNVTIKDRFFNSACSNPNIAFPQILKLFDSHIKKLKREKPGYAVSFEKQVQDLLSKLNVEDNPFPSSLLLNDQGLFILGYYQQKQSRYTKKEEE